MSDGQVGASIVSGALILLVMLAVMAVMIASMWKVFVKAGQPGWAAIVPVYNIIILLNIVGKPLWWIALFCLPLANIAVMIMISIEVAKSFGKTPAFGLGLAFLSPIFYPILGFGDARYLGPSVGTQPVLVAGAI
jgi:hypothetical protein